MKVTLGGDRLGSGNKNDLALHNYYRSTHNLSQGFTSPMTVGALYPFLVIPAMKDDKFEINLNADCITIPTVGPLFGSFKLQTDVFLCPIRLYQAFLHNNPTQIGLKMGQVLLPVYEQNATVTSGEETADTGKLNESCLMKYLGVSGIGRGSTSGGSYIAKRDFCAVPMLAYYDIFKNYYSNKQEQNAYVIGSVPTIENEITWFNAGCYVTIDGTDNQFRVSQNKLNHYAARNASLVEDENYFTDICFVYKYTETTDYLKVCNYILNNFHIQLFNGETLFLECTLQQMIDKTLYGATFDIDKANEELTITIQRTNNDYWVVNGKQVTSINVQAAGKYTAGGELQLVPFELKNIDDMRMAILSTHTLGQSFKVHNQNYLPYNINTYENNQFPLNGLVVKTYQSDIFNNWINTDWIDGENGIGEITKIDTSNGLKMDALNLAEKIYNMLNRIAVSGNTYQDWLEVVYSPMNTKHMESPIFCGGMSSEIVFEQIVQTAPADGDPLGTLAGRGRHIKRKGGHIVIKVDEPSFIIGITSITPRVKYSQGNEFYMTEIKSVDDMHKPALDGIGFQNLLGERMAWWDTKLNADGTINSRSVIGKIPAWLEYMTAVDKVYGDFANTDQDENGDPMGKGFMVLNRNYSRSSNGLIKDATTYIDPTKYNYAFAYSAIDAQNFWCEIYSHITARRLMSAKQIPNL